MNATAALASPKCRGTRHCAAPVAFACERCRLPFCSNHGGAWTACGNGTRRHQRPGEHAEAIPKLSPDAVRTMTEASFNERPRFTRAKSGGRKAKPERDAELRRRYEAGEMIKDIAKALGLSTEGVSAGARRLGLPRRPRRVPPKAERSQQPRGPRVCPVRDAEIARRWHAGENVRAIAAGVGASVTTVSRAARRLALPERARGRRRSW